jgi:hypothetical protein
MRDPAPPEERLSHCADSDLLVEQMGGEPTTSALRKQRSARSLLI